MNCRRAKKLIYDFIDGVIADQDRLTLEQHLGACGSCEKMASGLSRSLDLLHRVAPEELDENFTWKVRLRLARERNALAKDAVSHTTWMRSWNTRFAFSALSALVIVIAVGYFSFGPSSIPVDNLVPVEQLASVSPTAPAEIAQEESKVGFVETDLLKDKLDEQVAAKRTDEDSGRMRANTPPRIGTLGGFKPQLVSTAKPTAASAKNEAGAMPGLLKEDSTPAFLTAKELNMSDEKRNEQLERVIVDLRSKLKACGCEDH